MVFAGCCANQRAAGWERNWFLTWRWRVVSTVGRTTTWSACRNQLPYQQTSFSQNQAPGQRGHGAKCDSPVTPQPARAEAVNPLLHPERDWLPCSTGTDHCLQAGSDFDKQCADPYGIYFTWGFFFPFLTSAFAGMALQCVKRDMAGKSFGAITENQDTSALFMNYVQMGHHSFLVCL